MWPGLPGPGPRYRGQHSGGHLAAQSGGLTAATRGLLAATGLLLTKSPIPLDMSFIMRKNMVPIIILILYFMYVLT